MTTASIRDVDPQEISRSTVNIDASDCSIINNLALAVIGIVSVGLKAVALVNGVGEWRW
jgi:hypothetical protein